MQRTYYPDPKDEMYNYEVECLLPYVTGDGLDIGCGGRSITPEMKTLDIDPKKEPDIVAGMDNIPCPDESFDYVVAQHALEHIDDQEKALTEWVRILRKGGYILIIHPDVQYTGVQKPIADNPGLQNDPYNKHYHERTLNQFIEFIMPLQRIGFTLVDSGVAMGNWSFYIILRKNK